MPDLGGGSQQQPAQSSTTTAELPEWARGYAKDVLARGQALTDISQNPYQTYGENRIAGFSPLQQQAQQGAQALGPTAQTGLASGLAASVGAGAMNMPQYQAGRFSGGMFNTGAANAYMNPYVQAALNPQIALMQRQQGQQAAQMAGQATQAGAFGGSRFGLAQSQQNLNNQLAQQNLVGQGYNTAFQQAQNQFNQDMGRYLQAQQLGEQSRQFGANLGMQGLQTGLQAANTLGNLGQQQFAQQQGAIEAQSKLGAQEQALRQQGLDQAYQEFLNQQNYPYKQLGFMSDMIRGLPLGQTSTSQMYQSPGSLSGQLAGLGMGAYGMSRLFAADGGLMESDGYAEGGVTDDRNVESILSRLSDQQLQQARQEALNSRDQAKLAMIDEEMAQRASMRHGLASIPVDFAAFMPDQESMARGGIVAFAEPTEDNNYSLVEEKKPSTYGEQMSNVLGFFAGLPAAVTGYNRLETVKPAPAKAEKVAAKEEPKAKGPEVSAKPDVEQKVAAPVAKEKAAPAPADSITNAARIVTDAAKTEVPKDDVNKLFEEIFAKMNSAPRPEAEAFARMVDKAEKRAEDIKTKGVADALMKFGFGMAASAAKPGQARRAGLAGALESAAAASPLLAESVAENEKLQAAAEDNAIKLRLENARYQSALEQGNKQLAASLAGSISQRNLQQATLQEQINQNARANALKEKEISGLAAYRQQSAEPAMVRIAERYMKEDPNLSFDQAMTKASRAAGYSFRSDAAADLKQTELLGKLRQENPMYKAYEMQLVEAKDPKQRAQIQTKLDDIEMRAFGKLVGNRAGSVGSGKSGWSAEQIGG